MVQNCITSIYGRPLCYNIVPECVDEPVADWHEVEKGRLSPVLRRDLRDPEGHDGRQQEKGVVA
jgi:hypothetical protein